MRQIAGAVQEGAKAYLNRQVITISVIAVDHFRSALHFQRSSDGDRLCDRRVLFARGRFYWNAHRRDRECAHDPGRNQFAALLRCAWRSMAAR